MRLVLDENSKKINKFYWSDWTSNWRLSKTRTDEIKFEDLEPYIYPEEEIINKNNLKVYYFSYFFKWSMYENYKYIEKLIWFQNRWIW